MDDFFNKIKKKLSVDNIVDLMKDGKLKEEIKQTLTAGVNLNEKPKPDDFRPCLDVSSIEHSTEEGQSNVHTNENLEKPDTRTSITVASALESEVHVTMKNSYPETAEGHIKLPEKRPGDQFLVEGNNPSKSNFNEVVPTADEETTRLTDDKIDLIKENSEKQTDTTKSHEIEAIKVNSIVPQKPVISQPQLENSDKINFEMFLG